jgi:transcriptional regulator with XRE-family HTH domain
VGELVRRERTSQELTQQELCELSGVSYSTLSKLERGKNPAVRLDVLEKLLDALGMKLWVG